MIVEAFGVLEETALGDLRKYRRKYIPDLGRDPTASVYVVNETFVPRNVEEPDSEEWLQCYTEIMFFVWGNGLQSTLLPLRAEIEPFSTFNIGVLGSTYYIGFSAGCIWAPRLVRRVGHIRTFTAMVAIASVAPLVHSILPSAVLWWLVRAVTGFCLAALFMIIESWLNEKATNENRGVVFSAYTIISLTVVTLGQLMINVSEPGSFILFSLAAILVSLAAVPPQDLSPAAHPPKRSPGVFKKRLRPTVPLKPS